MLFLTACDVSAFFEIKENPADGAKCDICGLDDFAIRCVEQFRVAQKGKYNTQSGCCSTALRAHDRGFTGGGFFAGDVNMQTGFMEIGVSCGVEEWQIELSALFGDCSGYVGRKQ
mgnify:CR=1 FL=1